jgi:hypothetical protein
MTSEHHHIDKRTDRRRPTASCGTRDVPQTESRRENRPDPGRRNGVARRGEVESRRPARGRVVQPKTKRFWRCGPMARRPAPGPEELPRGSSGTRQRGRADRRCCGTNTSETRRSLATARDASDTLARRRGRRCTPPPSRCRLRCRRSQGRGPGDTPAAPAIRRRRAKAPVVERASDRQFSTRRRRSGAGATRREASPRSS